MDAWFEMILIEISSGEVFLRTVIQLRNLGLVGDLQLDEIFYKVIVDSMLYNHS